MRLISPCCLRLGVAGVRVHVPLLQTAKFPDEKRDCLGSNFHTLNQSREDSNEAAWFQSLKPAKPSDLCKLLPET